MELRRCYDDIYYHAEKTECDFILMRDHAVSHCFQVCWSVENRDTAEREIKGLLAALNAYRLEQGTILTNDEHADLERDGKKIFIRPLWYFALNAEKTNLSEPLMR
jgi:hypothetical protein